jgi:two-component system chemotaxis response regulator CheB
VREYLVTLFQSEPGLEVVGTAKDGWEAVQEAVRLHPDIITMDVFMPKMNGLEATLRIMQDAPTRIIVVSSSLDSAQLDLTFNAIQAGALGALDTPGGPDSEAADRRLIAMVRAMAEVSVVRRFSRTSKPLPVLDRLGGRPPAPHLTPGRVPPRVVALATSTGGPGALQLVLGRLPATYALPILVVQHIASGFGSGFVNWLNGHTQIKVRLAVTGDHPRPGEALLAPDDHHLRVRPDGAIEVYSGEPVRGLRPSADLLFSSMAQVFGASAAAVVLTGMGDDGAQGVRDIRRHGGRTFAQDEESCVVYGMPREAVLTGCIDHVVPLERIADVLLDLAREAG